MIREYWAGAKRTYHHTAPITMGYVLYEGLRLVLEEGLEARFLPRHLRNHELLRDGLEEMGYEFLVVPQYPLPMLNAVKIPGGIDDVAVRGLLLNEYNIEIGAGWESLPGLADRAYGLQQHRKPCQYAAGCTAEDNEDIGARSQKQGASRE